MSLIELLVAIVVLTAGVAGCVAAIPFAIRTNFSNRQQSNATVLAQMVMEKAIERTFRGGLNVDHGLRGYSKHHQHRRISGSSGASLVSGAVRGASTFATLRVVSDRTLNLFRFYP